MRCSAITHVGSKEDILRKWEEEKKVSETKKDHAKGMLVLFSVIAHHFVSVLRVSLQRDTQEQRGSRAHLGYRAKPE